MACSSCNTFTCTQDVPTCISSINIGSVVSSYISGDFTIYVSYVTNSEEVIYSQDFSFGAYETDITLDLTKPNQDYYNSFNGLYKIWVTQKGASMNARLQLQLGETRSKAWGVKFKEVEGTTLTTVTLVPQ